MRNYKLSCVGVDEKGSTGRMIFHVYAVKGIENAERIVRKDSYRRSLMRKHGLDWRAITLSAVETDSMGKTLPEFVEPEKEIRKRENRQMKTKLRAWKKKAREDYWKNLKAE